jgi:hypothetical protein
MIGVDVVYPTTIIDVVSEKLLKSVSNLFFFGISYRRMGTRYRSALEPSYFFEPNTTEAVTHRSPTLRPRTEMETSSGPRWNKRA